MMRRFALLFLLFIGLQHIAKAQSVTIGLPPGQDTTCIGEQLKFFAVVSAAPAGTSDTAFRWYHNGVLSGVTPDTFFTTAPVDGDNVYCWIDFTTPSGTVSIMSNVITIHRALNLNPRVLITLIFGSNPDCPGNPLTFKATPIHGGSAPTYVWLINGVPFPGATADTFTHIYSNGDTVQVAMTSTSECRNYDVAYSDSIGIVHNLLTATISITAALNPVCEGARDSFMATVTDAGSGSFIEWFVDTTFIPGAVGPEYKTDSLYNGAHVYAILHTPDACVIQDSTISNVITMVVVPNLDPTVTVALTAGANPGCKDNAVTFTAYLSSFGTAPGMEWYVNGILVASGVTSYTQVYNDGDLVSFKAMPTDGNCYTHDFIMTPTILMQRDTTPATPLVSLIDNQLVANTDGVYQWFFNGALIPGATGKTYHPALLGLYKCKKINGFCPSAFSNEIFISLLDVTELATGDVKVYPNPTNGILHADFGSVADVKLDVYNVLGQTVIHREIAARDSYDLDLSQQTPGNYFVVITDGTGKVSSHKILLAK